MSLFTKQVYANGFMVPPFATSTPLYPVTAGIRPVKMEVQGTADWYVNNKLLFCGVARWTHTVSFYWFHEHNSNCVVERSL